MVWRHPVLFAAAALMAVPAAPAWAGDHRISSSAPVFPIEHVTQSAMADSQEHTPYAMNYTDQAAQSLGVTAGHWEAFDTGQSSSDPLMPALRGGVDGGGAMIRLQWR